jgi:hypothetical protein
MKNCTRRSKTTPALLSVVSTIFLIFCITN